MVLGMDEKVTSGEGSGRGGSFRGYLVKVSNGMALGLFASLIIGLILRQAGGLLSMPSVEMFGRVAQLLLGPAIGAGDAFATGAPPRVLASSLIAGAGGVGTLSFAGGRARVRVARSRGGVDSPTGPRGPGWRRKVVRLLR